MNLQDNSNVKKMNWNILDNKLIKEFSFKNQTELAEFLLKVAKLADENDHHPDAEIYQCSRLRLKLFTHTENGISDLDRKLAKLIDSL